MLLKINLRNGYRDIEKMSRIIYNIRDILQEVVLWIVDI